MVNQQEKVNHNIEDCIENCVDCHRVCLETIQYCLRMGGEHAEEKHIRLLTDCAQICQISADFMIRGSELHHETCAACAEVCGRCADDCTALGADDEQMQECAERCVRCEESCAEMAGE
jgi:hypothetical protein